MTCKICAIANAKIISEVEHLLSTSRGAFNKNALILIAAKFPEFENQILAIDDQACKMHFNFHQKMTRNISVTTGTSNGSNAGTSSNGGDTSNSIAQDIGKDEAEVLEELLNAQAATFTAVTNQINKALTDPEHNISALLIHPETAKFYAQTADSIRQTVKELRELNLAQNGQKDNALEGLKALAAALHPTSPVNLQGKTFGTEASITTPNAFSILDDEMTTNEFDV